jgi:hypothetical protein
VEEEAGTMPDTEQLTPEQIERIRRDAFIEGYVSAVREWTSGQIAAISAAHKAYEKVKR